MVDGLGAAIVELPSGFGSAAVVELTALSGSRTGPPFSVPAAVVVPLRWPTSWPRSAALGLGRRGRPSHIVLGELAAVDRHQDQPPSTSWPPSQLRS